MKEKESSVRLTLQLDYYKASKRSGKKSLYNRICIYGSLPHSLMYSPIATTSGD